MSENMNRTRRLLCSLAATFALIGAVAIPGQAPAAGVLSNLFAGLNVNEGMTQFTGPMGTPVPVHYFTPKSNCPGPAVVLLHGSDGACRYHDQYLEIGRALAASGYSTFLVYYYEGAPGAPRPGPNDRGLPDPNAFDPWVHTVDRAVSFVQCFPGVDPARVGIMGLSLGGYVGSSVAVNDPRVRSLVVLSGGIPVPYADTMRTMPPTLIVHGDQDPDVHVSEAFHLSDRLSGAQVPHLVKILPCEGHLPYDIYKEDVAKSVLSFFDETL